MYRLMLCLIAVKERLSAGYVSAPGEAPWRTVKL